MAESVWVGGGWIGNLDRCCIKYLPLLWIPVESRPKWGGFLLPACPGAHLMVSSMDWLSRSWNWPQLAHPLVQEEMDAKHGTNMDWNKMVQTNYPTRMLCSKCFVTRGGYRHILFKSTLCGGGSIRENLWTLPDRNAQQNTTQEKRDIFYSQNNFCPTYFCFTAEVRALMELIIWSNHTVA
jgi:hypothetical protein